MPRSAYGFSKLAGEVYTRAAHDQHGLRYTICRPFNAYGPGEQPDPSRARASPTRCPTSSTRCSPASSPLEIFGSGEQTRTLTHIDDIADGIVTALGSPAAENEDFNISASEELTVAEIARRIWLACGAPAADFALRPPRHLRGRRAAPLALGGQGAAAAGLGGAGPAGPGPGRHRGLAARAGLRAPGDLPRRALSDLDSGSSYPTRRGCRRPGANLGRPCPPAPHASARGPTARAPPRGHAGAPPAPHSCRRGRR